MEEQVRKAIKAANRKFGEGIRKGDPKAVGALYTEDAIVMPPNNEMIRGRPGTEGFWGAAIKKGVRDAILTTVELRQFGNEIHEIGNYALKIQPEGQKPFEDKGKYVVIWKQEPEGKWKLHRDIWNSSLPPKG
jgi:ketosteroid isomerase-like protein